MIIFISHPYANAPVANTRRVRQIAKHLAQQGHVPVATHLMFHGIVSESQRETIMNVGFGLITISDLVLTPNPEFVTYGCVTYGCLREYDYAYILCKKIQYYDPKNWRKIKIKGGCKCNTTQ